MTPAKTSTFELKLHHYPGTNWFGQFLPSSFILKGCLKFAERMVNPVL